MYSLPVSEVAVQHDEPRAAAGGRPERAARSTVKENGNVVDSWPISSGKTSHATDPGQLHDQRARRTVQTMNGFDRDAACNVAGTYFDTRTSRGSTYLNADAEALHGAYWHNNFGNRMSHGCINLPLDMAHFLYGWAPLGTWSGCTPDAQRYRPRSPG